MISAVKLITGEEIFGDVTVGDRVTIKNPCILQHVPSQYNMEQPTMALVPIAMHLEDRSITVKEEHVMWMNTPVKEIYNQYNSYFGSGIQLAR